MFIHGFTSSVLDRVEQVCTTQLSQYSSSAEGGRFYRPAQRPPTRHPAAAAEFPAFPLIATPEERKLELKGYCETKNASLVRVLRVKDICLRTQRKLGF